ncbi:MAG TPA: hypothetical protein PLQ71_22525 [Nitrospira sp.]|nr:hypothetical protein [Nitrospira sp.]
MTAVLPFGGRHPDATENLSKLVPPRLAENARLHRELEAKRGTVWSLEDGLVRQATTIPIEPERILELFQYVARALVWFHWKVYFGSEHDSEVLMLTRYGKAYFDRLFAMRAAQRITHSVGNKTFEYAGVQGVDIPQISVWRFRMYGGMVFAGDPAVPNEVSNEIGVLTGPKRITGILSKEAAHQ